MTKNCVICAEDNVQAGHEVSKKHLKNAGLLELAEVKKKFSESRNGVVVTCTVCPTAYNAEPLLTNIENSKIEVSVKPREQIRYTFTIKNDNPYEIIFAGVAMLDNPKLNFTLNNNDVSFGMSTHAIQPKQCFREQVSITFENHAIGVYEMSVFFFFTDKKNDHDQPTIIFKEMVVFVETQKKQHEEVVSPYTQEAVFADVIVSSPAAARRIEDNEYQIPSKDYRTVFGHNLKTDGDGLTAGQKALAESIRNILKTGPTHNNYIKYFHHLLWFEETIIAKNLKNYNLSCVPLLPWDQRKDCYALKVPGLAEKRPSVMPGDFIHVRPHGQTKVMFEAIITDIEDTFAVFGFGSKFKRYYKVNAKFDIRFFMSRVPQERMHAAVACVHSTGATSKIYPRKSKSPKIKVIADDKYFNPLVAASAEQRAVVEHVVAGSSGAAPYLLLGAPGSGKTITIVEAILQLARDPNNRILVCTDSNTAADHVATKLIEYREQFLEKEFILRANSEFRVWKTFPKCLVPYSNGKDRNTFSPVSIKRFLGYRIVITTLIHAAKFGKELKKQKYQRITTHVFIDEAAQASEPASLVPVCGLLAAAGTLVLAGDPQQLGPVCISREAKDRGLGVSLMERLKNTCPLYSDENPDPSYFMMLLKNFRSHADILSIPNELFYNGRLEALAKPDPISVLDILGKKESRAIMFHGVVSSEKRQGKSPSFFNTTEAEIVLLYAKALVKEHRISEKDIGVITPYVKQVITIQEFLDEPGLREIEVGTVEGFQGKERRVIIASCVRAKSDLLAHDAKFQLGFVVDPQRFNVAMTRAKAKLIVIGNPLCLRKDDKWRKYMQKCRDFGTYAGFDAGADETDADRDAVLDQIAPIIRMIKDMKL